MEAPPSKDYQTSYTMFSTFREEPSTGVGTAYVTSDVANKSSRHAGKRLITQPLIQGRNPEVWFDKDVRSLADGDVYMDPMEVEKKLQQYAGGKPVTERAFFPPKNSKKSAFPGDLTPCMGKMGLLGEDWQNKPPGAAEKKPGKNLYTNPGKSGGMGYSHKDRTIGGNPPEYVPDSYQHGRQLGKELRRQARARIPKPFNSSPNRGCGLFHPNPYNNPPGPDKSRVKNPSFVPKKAFVPSNPPKKGAAYEAISKVGRDYVPEPIREAEHKSRSEAKVMPFKPCAGIKERLSMQTVNPYRFDARPAPNLDFTLLP